VRRADDRSQVVRIFDAIQHHVQPSSRGGLVERGVTLRRADRDDALVRCRLRRPVQLRARLEAHRDLALAAQLDQLLNARSAEPLRDQNVLEWVPGSESFPDRMDTC